MTDWQKGDLALCAEGKDSGKVYLVEAVVFREQYVGLVLEGERSDDQTGAWCATSFRKVTPPKDMILDEEELSPPTPVEA